MNERKKGISCRHNIVNALLYGLCAVIFFYRGVIREFDLMFSLLALLWLIGAVIWAVRAVRAGRKSE